VTIGGAPTKLFPASWQVEHGIEPTTAWFIVVPANVVKLPLEWQPSQAIVPVGMWFPGIVLTAGVPVNDSPAPWQAMQFDVKPAWFIAVPEKVVKTDVE
jgi:hypothetical protein